MTPADIATATNTELIDRLAEIAHQVATAPFAKPDLELKRETARIWQEFGERRRTNRLRMTPATIRRKVFQAHLRRYR